MCYETSEVPTSSTATHLITATYLKFLSPLYPFVFLLSVLSECFTLLCRSFPLSRLLFALTWQAAGVSSSVTLSIKNSLHRANRCVKHTRHGNSPITSYFFSGFLSSFIFPSLELSLYFFPAFIPHHISLTCSPSALLFSLPFISLSLWQFSPIMTDMQPLSSPSLSPRLALLFDTGRGGCYC